MGRLIAAPNRGGAWTRRTTSWVACCEAQAAFEMWRSHWDTQGGPARIPPASWEGLSATTMVVPLEEDRPMSFLPVWKPTETTER